MMDVLITTNSPGEVSAWVRPMVRAIKAEWPEARITVFIPPCTFASGREVPVVRSFPEVDLVVGPRGYLKYALFGLKPGGFTPSSDGIVLFLGGDLGHAALLGRRLRYPVFAYSERDAGHIEAIRYFFVPNEKVSQRLEKKGVRLDQIRIVGDLMHDAIKPTHTKEEILKCLEVQPGEQVLNIFPGSRFYEVKVTFPMFLQVAREIKEELPNIKPVITLAPFITLEQIRKGLLEAGVTNFTLEERVRNNDRLSCLHYGDDSILIYQGNSYDTMQVTHVALALPGTNNVELAFMGVPTFVVLPLNWPELIPLPGLVGIIGQIPVLGTFVKKQLVIPKLLPKFPLISPVNRSAGELIFPELADVVDEQMIAERLKRLLQEDYPQVKKRLLQFKKEEKASGQIISSIRQDLLSFPENRHGLT